MNGEGGDIRRSHHPADAEPGGRRWPERYEYRLTPKGRDLSIALAGLRQWGDKYISQKPPRITRRKSDKHPVLAAFVPKGAEVLRADEIETVPGPGLQMR